MKKSSPIDRLARAVRGEVVGVKAPGYDDARRIFNVEAQGRPTLVVQVLDAADVQATVSFARDEGLPLAVRGGGHSIGGYSATTGAVVIDLRALNEVSSDPAGIVTVGAGCTWQNVIDRLGADYAVTSGFDPRTGVAGLTLGGGYGMLTRLHGLASDGLVGAQVVTADGQLRPTSAADEPELLWALRGAGANFGVTTSLKFQVHRLPELLAAELAYPLSRARELLLFYREFVAGLPDTMTVYVGFATPPDGVPVVHFRAFHLGVPAEGERLLAPLIGLEGRLFTDLRVRSYPSLHTPGAIFPENQHHVWRAHFLRQLDDELIEELVDHLSRPTDHGLLLVFEHLGGAFGRIAGDATAFAHRDARFGFVQALRWNAGDKRPVAALRNQERLHRALTPKAIGTYVNYVGRKHTAVDVAAAYGANLPRLKQLKRRYDPANLFRNNVNIRPAR